MDTERDNLPVQAETNKKSGIVQKSIDFLDTAVSSIKGQDLGVLVEKYTAEVTLVLEGMHADYNALAEDVQQLSARLTILEEAAREQDKKTQDRIRALQKQVEALSKKNAEQKKRGRISGILMQVTWITALIAGAWVITTLVNTFGR